MPIASREAICPACLGRHLPCLRASAVPPIGVLLQGPILHKQMDSQSQQLGG